MGWKTERVREGYFAMISERKFSKSFSSFWNELLPIAEDYVRLMNRILIRYCKPTKSELKINRDKRSVINELSFRLFMYSVKGIHLSSNDKHKLSIKVISYIKRIAPNIQTELTLNKIELNEAEFLSHSLADYFKDDKTELLKFWPDFKGCGIIHSCKGDIIDNNKLIEVKAGDRNFRITDIRQIITYLALNSISKQYTIKNIALVNPRKGLSFNTNVEEFIEGCSKKKPIDIFGDIIDFISTEIRSI
jgi:hypothetical protein